MANEQGKRVTPKFVRNVLKDQGVGLFSLFTVAAVIFGLPERVVDVVWSGVTVEVHPKAGLTTVAG